MRWHHFFFGVLFVPHDNIHILKAKLDKKSLLRPKSGEPIPRRKSGARVEWIFDIRTTLLDPQGIKLIAEEFWRRFEKQYPFQIGGIEFSATPMVTAIQLEGLRRGYNVSGFVVRKERKTSGRCRQYEGVLNEHPIIVVDDILNSGESQVRVREVLDLESRPFERMFCVVDFENQDCCTFFDDVEITSLFTVADFGIDYTTHKKPPLPEPNMELQWIFAPAEPNYAINVPHSTPVAQDGRIWFGSSDCNFYCVDAANGQMIWTFKTQEHPKGILSSPALSDRAVFFGAYDGNVYALDKDTGKPVWINRDADFVGSSPALAPDLNLLFIGMEYGLATQKGALAALDLKTGEQKWWLPTAEYIHGSPAYIAGHNKVAVGTNDNHLLLADALTGELVWSFETGGEIKDGIAFSNEHNLLAFGSYDHNIYGIDMATGKERFRIETGNAVYATPLISDGKVWCPSTDRKLHVHDLESGQNAIAGEARGKIYSSPCLIDGIVVLGGNDGLLRGIDPQSRKLVWLGAVAERLLSSPVCHDGHIYITGAGGVLLCFKFPD